MEDIKNSLISQVGKLGPIGQSVLEFFGIGGSDIVDIKPGNRGYDPLRVQTSDLRFLGEEGGSTPLETLRNSIKNKLSNNPALLRKAEVSELIKAAEAEVEAKKMVEVVGWPTNTVIGSVGDTTTTQSSVTYISPERYAYLDMFEAGTGRGPPNTWHLN